MNHIRVVAVYMKFWEIQKYKSKYAISLAVQKGYVTATYVKNCNNI